MQAKPELPSLYEECKALSVENALLRMKVDRLVHDVELRDRIIDRYLVRRAA